MFLEVTMRIEKLNNWKNVRRKSMQADDIRRKYKNEAKQTQG